MFPNQRKDGKRGFLIRGRMGNVCSNQRKDGGRCFLVKGRMGEGVS